MVNITYIDHLGTARVAEAEVDMTLMEVARLHEIPGIEGECGGAASCATCHIYVHEEWLEKIVKPSSLEEDMLDYAIQPRSNSRLSCQIRVTPELEGLVVFTPERQS